VSMKPWLLEVNSSPAMSMETDIDNLVKPALIRDAINLCPFETYQEWLEKNRTKNTAKTSNIHKNFFSKRTTATNKKEEGMSAPKTGIVGSAKSQYQKPGHKLDSLDQAYASSGLNKKLIAGAAASEAAGFINSQPNLGQSESSYLQHSNAPIDSKKRHPIPGISESLQGIKQESNNDGSQYDFYLSKKTGSMESNMSF